MEHISENHFQSLCKATELCRHLSVVKRFKIMKVRISSWQLRKRGSVIGWVMWYWKQFDIKTRMSCHQWNYRGSTVTAQQPLDNSIMSINVEKTFPTTLCPAIGNAMGIIMVELFLWRLSLSPLQRRITG